MTTTSPSLQERLNRTKPAPKPTLNTAAVKVHVAEIAEIARDHFRAVFRHNPRADWEECHRAYCDIALRLSGAVREAWREIEDEAGAVADEAVRQAFGRRSS